LSAAMVTMLDTSLREHSSPFVLRAKEITPFLSEEPNVLTSPETRKTIQSKLDQNSTRAVLDHF
jgi:hypothetical protein